MRLNPSRDGDGEWLLDVPRPYKAFFGSGLVYYFLGSEGRAYLHHGSLQIVR